MPVNIYKVDQCRLSGFRSWIPAIEDLELGKEVRRDAAGGGRLDMASARHGHGRHGRPAPLAAKVGERHLLYARRGREGRTGRTGAQPTLVLTGQSSVILAGRDGSARSASRTLPLARHAPRGPAAPPRGESSGEAVASRTNGNEGKERTNSPERRSIAAS